MTTYKAIVDLVVAGKGVRAGSTFDTSDEQAAPAVAFGLAELSGADKSEQKPKAKSKAKVNVRVRHEPPTLDEAIFAAQGLSDNLREQIEIAATLIGMPEDQVRQRVMEQGGSARTGSRMVVTSNRAGTQRSVIVERKTPRRVISAPTGPLSTPASFPR